LLGDSVSDLARAQPATTTVPTAAAPVRLNTVGYPPDSPKQATVASSGERFIIRDADKGREVFRGRLLPIGPDSPNGPVLRIADFSALTRKGSYRLEIPGGEASCRFRIDEDIYNWPFYCAARAMYLWRCGTAVNADFGGHTFRHEACHLQDAYLDYVGGPTAQRKDGTGGWHDAGDYNKYTVNAAFTLGMILHAWEHFADNLAPLKLDLPESGNDVPDILDEARWELNWLLKMQAGDGRVYHKLSTLRFGGFILPEAEKKPRYFSPWGSAATADFAAVMAQAARAFRPVDHAFSQQCLAAARKSYEFLHNHPEDHRPDLSLFSTGSYDSPDADDRLWAAAEMWQTTGEPTFLSDFQQRVASSINKPQQVPAAVDIDWDWHDVGNLGAFTYLLSKRPGRDPVILAQLRRDALAAADAIVEAARRHPYGRTLDSKYYWGCNGTIARQAMNLEVARRLTGESRYRTTIIHAISHLLGRNPFGRSYVTGLGHRPPMLPHDRRSGGDQLAAPWPGYLVGGPWPKPTDWYDVEDDFRTNEVAINWNGALIYALAAFVEPRRFEASLAAAQRRGDADSNTEP
jgi:endoglucanase